MKLIQFILIPALLIAVLIYVRRFRTLLLDRLIVMGLGLVAILLVINPDWNCPACRELRARSKSGPVHVATTISAHSRSIARAIALSC